MGATNIITEDCFANSNDGQISLSYLAELVGFSPETLKNEINVKGESISLTELRERMMEYLDENSFLL